MKSKPEMISFSDFLMIAPFYDLRSMFAPEIEYLKNGIEGLLQSGLIKQDEKSELIEYQNSVAILTIEGPLRPGRDWYFGTGYGDIQDAIVELIDKPEIKTVIQSVDSPGGSVKGAFETEELFQELAKEKTIVSLVTGAATSAAALMTFPASKRYLASKTAQTGSIGVVAEHIDNQAWYREFWGEIRTSVAKGDLKDAGTDVRPYDEKAKIVFEEAVNKLYDVFATAATEGLGIDRQKIDDMQSRVYIGSDGIDQGFADGFLTLNELVEAYQNTDNTVLFTPGRPAYSNIQSEEKRMDIKTLEAEHPDVYKAVLDRGKDEGLKSSTETAKAEGKAAGILLERNRQNDIDALRLPEDFTAEAKKSDWTVEKTAQNFLLAEAEKREKFTEGMKSDLNNGLEPDTPDVPKTPDTDAKDPIRDFDDAVKAEEAKGNSRGKAMKIVKEANPDLHANWLKAKNEGGTQ